MTQNGERKRRFILPFVSSKQRRLMHARHPEIAARWEAEARAKHVKRKAKPKRAKKRSR